MCSERNKNPLNTLIEIKKAKTNKRRKILNRNEGNLVKRNTWTPLFAKLPEKGTNTRLDIKFRDGLQ